MNAETGCKIASQQTNNTYHCSRNQGHAGPCAAHGPLRSDTPLTELRALALAAVAQAPALRRADTYAIEISEGAYAEIRAKLVEANYDHLLSSDGGREVIDMAGLAVAAATTPAALEFHRVESTNVWAYAYTPGDQTLHVQFKSGGSYRYSPVTAEDLRQFVETPSKGGFIATLKARPGIVVVFVENWKAVLELAARS